MQLIDNARDVARRAWSVRLGVMAGIGEGVTLLYPLMFAIDPPVWMSAIVFVLIVAGVVSRFVAQKGLSL